LARQGTAAEQKNPFYLTMKDKEKTKGEKGKNWGSYIYINIYQVS
jgi:hypothetical protein